MTSNELDDRELDDLLEDIVVIGDHSKCGDECADKERYLEAKQALLKWKNAAEVKQVDWCLKTLQNESANLAVQEFRARLAVLSKGLENNEEKKR